MSRYDVQRVMEDAAKNRDRSRDAHWGDPTGAVGRAVEAEKQARAYNAAIAQNGLGQGVIAYDETTREQVDNRPRTNIGASLSPEGRAYVRAVHGLEQADIAAASGLPVQSVVEYERRDPAGTALQSTSPLTAGLRVVYENLTAQLSPAQVAQLQTIEGIEPQEPQQQVIPEPSSRPLGRPIGA